MYDNRMLVPVLLALAAMLTSAPIEAQASETKAGDTQARRVTINRVHLTADELSSLEQQYRVHIADGDYWYDRRMGLWGVWGGPAVGFAVPGLDAGGPLTREASGGVPTGVFVNDRELHPADVAAIQTLMMVVPGRYWMDASGWGGYEGGPPLFNLWALAAQAQSASRGDRSWIHRGPGGGMGSDGNCIYYIGRDGSASTGC